MLLQEHKLADPFDIEVASAWALSIGYKSVWQPAVRFESGKASAGVAIFVVSGLGVRPACEKEAADSEGRLVFAMVNMPGFDLLVASAYLHDSVGLSEANVVELARIGLCLREAGTHFVVGADWNMQPEVLSEVGYEQKLGGQFFGVESADTCRKSTGGFSNLDFFAVSLGLADTVEEVRLCEAEAYNPHKPVVLSFAARQVDLLVWAWLAPQELPMERVVPEAESEVDWSAAFEAAVAAKEAAQDTDEIARATLDHAYELWANTAERQLAMATGTKLFKEGLRARPPRFGWRPALLQRLPPKYESSQQARPWCWLRDTAAKLHHACLAGEEVKLKKLHQLLATNRPSLLDGDEELRQATALLEQLAGRLRRHSQAGPSEGLLTELELFADEVEHKLADKKAEDRANNESSWQGWAKEATAGAARAAHKLIKKTMPWVATTTVLSGGMVTASPRALLEAEGRKWQGIWGARLASSVREPPALPQGLPRRSPMLRRLSPRELRELGKRFGKHTAGSLDGFRLQHLALLSEPGLQALSEILLATDQHGFTPTPTEHISMPMLAKPAGGHRLIGLFSFYYRVWSAGRRPYSAEWEAKWDEAFFAAGKGRGPIEVMWKVAARSEAKALQGGVAASLTWDLASFYEYIDHQLLADRAIADDFPLQVLRTALRAYLGPRHITCDGCCHEGLVAIRSIVAGCSQATTLVKVYYRRPLLSWSATWVTIQLDVYLDDFTMAIFGTEEDGFVLVRGAKAMHELIENQLRCQVSVKKCGLAATTKKLAMNIRAGLGKLAGPGYLSYKCLGIDSVAGRTRASAKTATTMASRFVKAGRKQRRLRLFTKVVPGGVAKLFVSGVRPTATYGAEARGMANSQLLRLRKMQVAATFKQPAARSRTATLCLLGDAALPLAFAAVLRWARETWVANTSPRSTSIGLGELAAMWRTVARKWPRSFAQARGPIGAAKLELDRAGWLWPSPFVLQDDEGEFIQLTTWSPQAVKDRLFSSANRRNEAHFAQKHGADEVSFEAAKAFLASSANTVAAKTVAKTLVTGGFWPAQRLADAGYDHPPGCPLCGAPSDTMWHRLWRCSAPAVKVIREKTVIRAMIDRAVEAGEDSLIYTKGLLPNLGRYFPGPETEEVIVTETWDGQQWQPCQPEGFSLGGQVAFSDGSFSCWQRARASTGRAGWAVVSVDASGDPVARAYGPLWAPHKQSAPSSEWGACSMAARIKGTAAPPLLLWVDCQQVVSAFGRSWRRRLHPSAFHAGHFVGMLREGGGEVRIRAEKATAHLKEKVGLENLVGEEFWQAKGNDLADEAAKRGRRMHPRASPLNKLLADALWQDALATFQLAAQLVSHWPRHPRLGRKHPRQGEVRSAAAKATAPPPLQPGELQHGVVRKGPAYWACRWCSRAARSGRTAAALAQARCSGLPGFLVDLVGDKGGHQLHVGHSKETGLFLICTACGAYATSQPVFLRQTCLGPSMAAGRRAAVRLYDEGWFPDYKKRHKISDKMRFDIFVEQVRAAHEAEG